MRRVLCATMGATPIGVPAKPGRVFCAREDSRRFKSHPPSSHLKSSSILYYVFGPSVSTCTFYKLASFSFQTPLGPSNVELFTVLPLCWFTHPTTSAIVHDQDLQRCSRSRWRCRESGYIVRVTVRNLSHYQSALPLTADIASRHAHATSAAQVEQEVCQRVNHTHLRESLDSLAVGAFHIDGPSRAWACFSSGST